jgi:peptide/nickel transport system substrate-binding protein
MKKMGKLSAVLLCVAMLISLVAACGQSNTQGDVPSDTPSEASGDTSSAPPAETGNVSARDSITIAITQDRGTLDPLYTVGWDNQQCLRLVYEPLWEYDEDYKEIKWVLATSIDDSDPLKWTVKLRDDVTFANGNKFTADDVVYSLWLANNRKGEPPYFLYMDNEATRAIDDTTVEIVFTEFNVSYALSFATIFMYDKESYNADTAAFETNGSGPYKVTDYVIQSHLSLTARDDYWGEAPPIKNVTFKVLMEDAQRVNALETGEVDVSGVPFQDVEYVRGLPELSIREAAARSQRAVFLNVTNPDSIFYDNMDARLAVFYAINPEAVLKIVYNGYGDVSKAPYSIHATDADPSDYGKGIYGHGYDLELAKQLAESSGLKGAELVLINNGSSDMVTTSELVQQALKEIGVNVKIQTTDAGSWLTYRFDDKAFDLCVDFTGGNPATADLSVWWQYAGNCGTDTSKTPEAAATLRQLGDEVAKIADANERAIYRTKMSDELVKLNYFYNLVDMITFQAYNKNLELPRTSNSWIDWSKARWTA